MTNSLYEQLNPQVNRRSGLAQQIADFKKNLRGNPQDMIQGMLNSGRISQRSNNRKTRGFGVPSVD